MKRFATLCPLFVLLSLLSFTSCEEDSYLDWKYLNESWYASHQADEGWQTTASGLQYKVVYEGMPGDDKRPSSKSGVEVTYTGSYITGKTFDDGEGVYLTVAGVVPGFGEALKLMKKNAIYEVRVPYTLGYGEDGYNAIPPYSTLLFRIRLDEFWTE